MAGQRIVRSRVMILHRVVHRADQRDFIHDFGHARKMLVHLNSRNAAGNGLVRAANSRRRFRLHVKHVKLAWPSELIEENDRLGASLGRLLFAPFLAAQQDGCGEA